MLAQLKQFLIDNKIKFTPAGITIKNDTLMYKK